MLSSAATYPEGDAPPTVQMPENANKTKFSSMIVATAAHSG